MSERWKAKNHELRGRTVTMRGGAVAIDERGFLPVDMSPEQLEHARHSGLFESVKVTRASIIKDELAASQAKLAELEQATGQAYKIFRQWEGQHDEALATVRALEDELAAIAAVKGPEPAPAPPEPAPVDLDEADWEQLKDLARAHDVPIARRTKDEIKADLAAALGQTDSGEPPTPSLDADGEVAPSETEG